MHITLASVCDVQSVERFEGLRYVILDEAQRRFCPAQIVTQAERHPRGAHDDQSVIRRAVIVVRNEIHAFPECCRDVMVRTSQGDLRNLPDRGFGHIVGAERRKCARLQESQRVSIRTEQADFVEPVLIESDGIEFVPGFQ